MKKTICRLSVAFLSLGIILWMLKLSIVSIWSTSVSLTITTSHEIANQGWRATIQFLQSHDVPVRGTYWDLLGEYARLSCEFPLKIQRLTSQLVFASTKDKMDIISEIETLTRQVRETEAIRSKLHWFFNSDLMIERRQNSPIRNSQIHGRHL